MVCVLIPVIGNQNIMTTKKKGAEINQHPNFYLQIKK